MPDLFAEEESFLQKYKEYLKMIPEGGACEREAMEELVTGYARILRQLRTLTRLSDRTTENLNCAKQELMQKVHFDALTGVCSRRFMNEKMKEYTQAGQGDAVFCFMMADVDFFKKYNDVYGHPVGDICLKTVASALSECICDTGGFVARYGGEEFAIILPHTDEAAARQLGEALLQAVSQKNIPHKQNTAAEHVTVSIGCVTGILRAGCCAEAFIEAADKALYQSKQGGRNRITHLKLEGGQK